MMNFNFSGLRVGGHYFIEINFMDMSKPDLSRTVHCRRDELDDLVRQQS